MITNCANPECGAEFLYLHEGVIFVIELPDKSLQRYWLCRLCARDLRVEYDAFEGVKLVRSEVKHQTEATAA